MTFDGEGAPSDVPAPRKWKKLRKEEIVAEASRLFAERGYEGTSMGDLAERVGLRKASLFHHFESKDALYATVLARLITNVEAAISAAASSEGNFVDRLDALTDALTETLGAEPYRARLLIREAMDWRPIMSDQLASAVQSVLSAAVEFARAGQRSGDFNPDLDVEQIVISLIGVYFMPFVIDRTVAGLVGSSPFEPPFIERRRHAVREQIRSLMSGRA